MRRPLAALLVPLVVVLAGCPGEEDASCDPQAQKAATRDLMRSWYLYPELLADVSPFDPAYPTLDQYLWALTRPAREKQPVGWDRGWTYATTVAATQQFFEEGTSVGFGIGLLYRPTDTGTRVFVSQVFAGSAADDAGFARGDEIVAIAGSAGALDDPSALVPTHLTKEEVQAFVGSAFGPSAAGVTRAVRVVTVAGATEARTMTKRTYGLDPVPEWAVIPRDGTTPAGYVALRTFIGPADARLGQAFQAFKDAGVTDVVVDLRYNGGGLVSTATLLANLLGGDRTPGDLMFEFQFNDFHASENWSETFQPPVQAIAPFRVAFVTTDSSASASELVPNVLEAWKQENVALVGGKTYGKPVGQYPFAYEACGTVVYLIAFRLLNADGDGGYYGGLPDAEGNFSGPLCAAADDLTHAQSDPQEASTAAALHWLATGTCPAAAAAAKPGARAALKGVPGADGYPEASEPDLAQRHVRGLF